LSRAKLAGTQVPDEESYAAIKTVRDLGELNRLLALIPKDGIEIDLIVKDYRWKSLKGYLYQGGEILSLAEVLGLVSIAGAKVKSTPFGFKFHGLNPSLQYELTDDQRSELCRFVFNSMTPLAAVAGPIFLSFRYSAKNGRYEYSLPDYGPPPGRNELYFFLETLGVLGHNGHGTMFIEGAFTKDVATKVRRLRQLTDEELLVSPELLELSRHAERLCFDFEQDRLKALGRPDLATKVELVADYDATVGYDILSYDGHSSRAESPDRLVEVKSTPTDRFHFFLSEPELRKARQYGKTYWVYHLRKVTKGSKIGECYLQQIRDPATQILDPTVFEISAESLHVICLRKDLGPPAP